MAVSLGNAGTRRVRRRLLRHQSFCFLNRMLITRPETWESLDYLNVKSCQQAWHLWAVEIMADAISRVIECVTELMDAVSTIFNFQDLLPWMRESVRTLQAPWGQRHSNAEARQVVASVLRHNCQEPHPAGFVQVRIGDSSMHKHFWTQMPWLQSLVQTKGIFVSLCLLAQP